MKISSLSMGQTYFHIKLTRIDLNAGYMCQLTRNSIFKCSLLKKERKNHIFIELTSVLKDHIIRSNII